MPSVGAHGATGIDRFDPRAREAFDEHVTLCGYV
jgi:hypothetical protein